MSSSGYIYERSGNKIYRRRKGDPPAMRELVLEPVDTTGKQLSVDIASRINKLLDDDTLDI
jgi:hypothetical protein